jgi:hypothetical protein
MIKLLAFSAVCFLDRRLDNIRATFLCHLVSSQTELQAGAWEYSKEEVLLTDESTGADFAAAGFTHLITAHPENGTHCTTSVALLQHVAGLSL